MISAAFVEMLNDMRVGIISAQAALQFRASARRVIYEDGIEPTELCVVVLAFAHHIG